MFADNVKRCHSISDLRQVAKKRLPKFVFDYIDGGVEDEYGLRVNQADFREWRFVPRYLRSSLAPALTTKIFGRAYSAPFGIAPTGLAGLIRPGADAMLAEAAAENGLPYIMSGVSNLAIERAKDVAGDRVWYQLYPTRQREQARKVTARVRDAGIETLVCTVDLPSQSKRERDLRNGFGFPLTVGPAMVWAALSHPGWALRYLQGGGVPYFENWRSCLPVGADALEVAQFVRSQSPADYTWDDIEDLRDEWKGNLIIKGLMHPEDIQRAIAIGADGVIISNHGGRQLDRAASSIRMLAHARKHVGTGFPLMLDSGICRGSDIVTALCLGATMVFAGRAPLYGVGSFGRKGAARALEVLLDEMKRTMSQIGASSPSALEEGLLVAG